MHLCQYAGEHKHNGTLYEMFKKNKNRADQEPQRIRMTVHLSLSAYDVLTELQRQHRLKTGKALPIRQIIDAAIINYAKRN